MPYEIQAIETVYKGYRFRSRLEARWAVFFDEAGIYYEYEPEGYDLPNGSRYLPDFRITANGMTFFCEIKPIEKDAILEGLINLDELVKMTGKHCSVVALFVGPPGDKPIAITILGADGKTYRIKESISDFFDSQYQVQKALYASRSKRFEFEERAH